VIRLRWRHAGFSVLCEILASRISPPPALKDIGGPVAHWLSQQLAEVERLADRWPEKSLQATVIQGGALLATIDLVPTSDLETWDAAITGRTRVRRRRGPDLMALLDSARLEVAIAGRVETDELVIDDVGRHAFVDGADCGLTRTEWALLRALLHASGDAVRREQLRKLGPHGREISDRALTRHMSQIRAKLGRRRDRLETVRGLGYRLDSGPGPADVVVGPLRINPGARRAWCDGDPLRLSPGEFHVLLTLARASDLERFHTAEQLRGPTATTVSSVKVRIANLRQKMGARRGMIRTRRGSGYCLDPQGSDDFPPGRPT
jgi:DNA-binding response OmpR family regulator